MELVKLIECKLKNAMVMDAEDELCVYEVYAGEWVKVYSDSANAYWHKLIDYTASEKLSKCGIVQRACIMVLSDGGYVGHWESITDFYEFLEIYMRASIIEEVVA